MFTSRFVVFVGALLLAFGAHAEQKKKPRPPKPVATDQELGFVGTTRDALLASIKRVGLVPAQLPQWAEENPVIKKAVHDAVAQQLATAGFEVVGPETYEAAYERFSRLMGGLYDPKTGAFKRDVAGALFQNARREFIAKEHLDGYVLMGVIPVSAKYQALEARWDGVRDRADGGVPGHLARILNTGGDGELTALSLRIQISNSQDRVLFARNGGVQLANYFDGTNFSRVATSDLLRDNVRIERAARVAVLPLVRTPREIADGLKDPAINAQWVEDKTLPALPSAELLKAESAFRVPRDQILGKVKRVAVTRIVSSSFDIPDEVRKRLMDLVRAELAPLNWEIVDAPDAYESLQRKFRNVELYNPWTGKRDEARSTEIQKAVFTEVGRDNPPDAILWLRVVRVTLQQRQGNAVWDGVDQNAFTRGPVVRKFWTGTEVLGAGIGPIAAMSFSAQLTDSEGEELYYWRGGMELVQSIKIVSTATNYQADPVDLAPGELFRDPTRERPAIHAAFRDLVMTPEALFAELNPDPKLEKAKEKERKKSQKE